MLEIQKFIKEFESISLANQQLGLKYNIEITSDILTFNDGTTEVVYVYNYDHIKAKGDSEIENEARGLILNSDGDIVSLSFKRFFNINEKHAAKIDWSSAVAESKADGSLVVIYNYKDKFFIQTRGSATASGTVNGTDNLYKQMVIDVLKNKFPSNPLKPFIGFSDTCFVFEFISPINRIVTPYENDDLILLSCFNKKDTEEAPKRFVDLFAKVSKFERPNSRKVENVSDVEKFIELLPKLDEGFVIVDGDNNRVKVKNKAYLSISRAINAGGKLSPKHLADIVLQGSGDEISSYYEEFTNITKLMERTIGDMTTELNDLWATNKNAASQRDFAMAVKEHPLSGVLFAAWKLKIEVLVGVISYIKHDVLIDETAKRYPEEYEYAINKIMEKRCIQTKEVVKDE